ncbi:MAG: protein kinase, partial [Planctomycetales bacterium]|nr:protein kinase [Planctomycetales bacterium]NIM09933.1 protein kinase [Planctomycetales bacterium]NIN09374.1 protein kinase [Planctomycetales bacterium]NIN78481.1 protein kinase [Planctomycetales bacterium]NIO35672.1 protein kinase [Planctomycetales bacterium]
MSITTPEQFFDCLSDSGILSETDVQAARQMTAGLPDARTVAKRLANQGFLSRWQALQVLAGKLPAYLGKYKLLDQLGASETGAAFLAEHEQMERRVVVKVVNRKGLQAKDALDQFLDEARHLAAIDHRNMIHVFDVDSTGGQYYLVLEYVEGESLQSFVDRHGPLAFDAAAGYIALSASALAEAHQQQIWHHRLQPDRLLLDMHGELKVLDIGLARLADPQEDQRRASDQESGDVDYVAPEQATGKNKVDHRADVYALGCCFYFLLTGQVPYGQGNRAQRLKARLRPTAPDVRELRPDTPQELAEICAQMMATQPRQRLSIEQVGRQLGSWLKQQQAAQLSATALNEPPATIPAAAGKNGEEPQAFPILGDTEGRSRPTSAQVPDAGEEEDEEEELAELLDDDQNKKVW